MQAVFVHVATLYGLPQCRSPDLAGRYQTVFVKAMYIMHRLVSPAVNVGKVNTADCWVQVSDSAATSSQLVDKCVALNNVVQDLQ